MKKMNKIFSILSLILVFLIASCNLAPKKLTEKAFVSFEVSGKLESVKARSVQTPEIDNSELYFVLTYYQSEETKFTKTFESLADLEAASLEIEFSTWNFILKAYESSETDLADTVYIGQVLNKVINSDAAIAFEMEYGDATGEIEFTVSYPANQNVTLTIETRKIQNTGDVVIENSQQVFSETEGNGINSVVTEADVSTAVYSLSGLPAGNYSLVFTVNYKIQDTAEADTFGMELFVPVIPTVTTEGEYEFSEINKVYSISYDSESFENAVIDENSTIIAYPNYFKKYRKVRLPSVTKTNNTFVRFYYVGADGEDYTITDNILNSDYTLDSNVTIYAEWEEWHDTTVNIGTAIPDFEVTVSKDFLYMTDEPVTISAVPAEGKSFDESASVKWYVNGRSLSAVSALSNEVDISKLDMLKEGKNIVTAIVGTNGHYESRSNDLYIYTIETVANDKANSFYSNYRTDANGLLASDKLTLAAYCYDAERNLYLVSNPKNESDSLELGKYTFNKEKGVYSENYTKIATFPLDTYEFIPWKIACDGKYVYYISKTAIGRSLAGLRYTSDKLFYVQLPADGESVEVIEYNNENSVPAVEVSAFTSVTALAYNDGVLYIAGEKSNKLDEPNKIMGAVYDEEKKEYVFAEENQDVYNNTYSVKAFTVTENGSDITLTNSATILEYDDESFETSYPEIFEIPEDYIPSFEYPLAYYKLDFDNIISDIAFVDGKIYAIQNLFLDTHAGIATVNEPYNYMSSVEVMKLGSAKLLVATPNKEGFEKIDLPKSYSYYGKTTGFIPTRFIAIKPEELILSDGANESVNCSVYLPDGTVDFDTATGSGFDKIVTASGNAFPRYVPEMNYHCYKVIKTTYED